MENIFIRNISNDDIEAVNSLYNYYIRETAFTFDIKEKTLSEKKEWSKIFKKDSPYQCIVAYDNDILIGFASSRPLEIRRLINLQLKQVFILVRTISVRAMEDF